MSTSELLSLDNAVFKLFAFYVAILMAKMILMSLITGLYRVSRKKFRAPEDYAGSKRPFTGPQSDPDIDRVVRMHANDLENIVPFVISGILYVLCQPSLVVAAWYFRIFAGARILHSLVYFFVVPQPARLLCFTVGFIVNCLMLGTTIAHLL